MRPSALVVAPAPPPSHAFLTPPRLPPSMQTFLHSLPQLPFPQKHRKSPPLPPPPPESFRINAWRWHHLAIEAQLHALATASVPPTAASLDFLSASNWDVHDRVESAHLAPLLAAHLPPHTLRELSQTRARLSRARAALRADLRAGLQPVDARRRLGALCGAAAAAFAASEAAVVPAAAAGVPAAEQDRFNARVVRGLGRGRARIALVMFYDTLFGGGRGVAGVGVGRVGCTGVARVVSEDRRRFRDAIPGGIRVLLPIWRRGFARKYPDMFLDLT